MPGQRDAGGPKRAASGIVALLAALALTQLACTNLLALPAPAATPAVISGTVYGDRLQDQQAGKTVLVPLLATVRCNEASATTKADGSYRVTVSPASQYVCSASARSYTLTQADLVGSLGPVFHLDFGGPARVTSCTSPAALTPAATDGASPTASRAGATASATATPTPGDANAATPLSAQLECPELHLVPGSVTGTVTNADDHTPASGTRLTCWNPHLQAEDAAPTQTYQTETDSNGAFAFADLPIDRYLCTVASDPVPTVMSPSPGAATTVAVTVCGKHCPPVTYQGGPVMHSMTAYVVFWLPSGAMYSSVGNAHFEDVIERYFHDVGGSSYYNIVTQYWDTDSGFPLNQVTLGDVYVDTHPYPHAGTRSDPLLTSDIEHEVQAVVAARDWTSDTSHAVFIFTAYNAQLCDGGAAELCTYPGGSQEVFCGYHSLTDQTLIFALIADTESCSGSAYTNAYASPNGDRLADEAIITTSHEQFESATDPDSHGWYAGSADRGEIGDKCVQSYRQVQLGGHPYWVQAEWSDRSDSCVYGM